MRDRITVIEGTLQDETITYTLIELSEMCVVERPVLDQMIEYGIIEPKIRAPQLKFDYRQFNRAQKALRLQRDLAINWEGISLVLDLLDQIQELHEQLELHKRKET